MCDEILRENKDVCVKSVLLNNVVENPKSVVNMISLATKQYISASRCANKAPNFQELKRVILQYKNFEKYYAVKDNKIPVYLKRWECNMLSPVPLSNDIVTEYLSQLSLDD